MATTQSNTQNNCLMGEIKKKRNLGMFQIFEQAKKLCKKEQHSNNEEKHPTFFKLKAICSQITRLLSQPYTHMCTEFVGALCIFVYIMRSSKNFQKLGCTLKKQFYANLPCVLAEAYSSYQKKCLASTAIEKGTTFSTLLRITMEIHEENPRLRRKVFSDKMINLIVQMRVPEREDLFRQSVKLKINALYFANFQQKILLNKSLLDIFDSYRCDSSMTGRILQTIQNLTPIDQLPPEKIKKLIQFLKYKIKNCEERLNQPRPMAWFYLKYIHLCEKESFSPQEMPDIFRKFRKSVGLQKNLLKSILENITLKNEEDQILVMRKFVDAEGIENQIYTKLLIQNFPNFDSGAIIPISTTGFLPKLDYILTQQDYSQRNKTLAAELYQKMKEWARQANSVFGWAIQKNIESFYSGGKNIPTLIPSENLSHCSLR